MNILALYQSTSGCDYHRVFNVLQYFPMKNGDRLQLVTEKVNLYEPMFEEADIVFFNRLPHFITNDKLFELRAKYGFKICVDIDDYWRLYPHHILYNEWANQNVTERIEECLTFADLITVTNRQLQIKVKQINNKVEILPNALPFGMNQFDYKPVEHSTTNIIYAGGSSHLHDLKDIASFFKKLGSDDEFLEKGKFIFAGFNNVEQSKTSVYAKMLNVVQPIGKFQLRPPYTVNHYMDHYNDADISIAPLEFNGFNLFKSNLKTIEAACKKIPILTSSNMPYKIDENIQGITLCSYPIDFYNKIKYYLQNPLKIQEDGVALHEAIKEKYNFKEINEKRYDLFKFLANN